MDDNSENEVEFETDNYIYLLNLLVLILYQSLGLLTPKTQYVVDPQPPTLDGV